MGRQDQPPFLPHDLSGYPSHPLISSATQDRADPSEDRSLACSVGVSLGSKCAPLTFQKTACSLLSPSQRRDLASTATA